MATGIPQDRELREAIEAIGDAVLPFAQWAPEAKLPPSIWVLGVYDVLDELIGESDFDDALIERLESVASKPLQGFPARDPSDPPQTPEEWRTDHGFDQLPIFEMDSKNRPLGRRAFYALYWPALVNAVRSAKKEPDFTWLAFAGRLLKDTGTPHWPVDGVKSSELMKALVRDFAIAVLGMKNWDAEANPSKDVFLRALGEGRFVGNKHTREEVDSATKKIRHKLAREWKKGEPS